MALPPIASHTGLPAPISDSPAQARVRALIAARQAVVAELETEHGSATRSPQVIDIRAQGVDPAAVLRARLVWLESQLSIAVQATLPMSLTPQAAAERVALNPLLVGGTVAQLTAAGDAWLRANPVRPAPPLAGAPSKAKRRPSAS